jgi:hypothetical protein
MDHLPFLFARQLQIQEVGRLKDLGSKNRPCLKVNGHLHVCILLGHSKMKIMKFEKTTLWIWERFSILSQFLNNSMSCFETEKTGFSELIVICCYKLLQF